MSTEAIAFSKNLHELLNTKPNDFSISRGRIADFSETFGVSYNVSYRVLNGLSMPNSKLLCRIAKFFDIEVEDLIGEE